MKDYTEIEGKTFGQVLVLNTFRKTVTQQVPYATVICQKCGKTSQRRINNVLSGEHVMCSCSKLPSSSTVVSYRSMFKNLYFNKQLVEIDPDWSDFNVFLNDMGERPEGCILWRKDKTKGFNKNNCIWKRI